MIATVEEAAKLVSQYGNISGDPGELLRIKPTESDLNNAASRCHLQVDMAVRLLKQHHGLEQK